MTVAHLDTDRTDCTTHTFCTTTSTTTNNNNNTHWMKLCTALGWKVCCVSLHYNLDALEITQTEHTGRSETEFRGDSGCLHGRLLVSLLSPPNPVGQTCRARSWVSVTVMEIHQKASVPSCCMDRERERLRDWQRERVWTEHVNAAAERCDVRERERTITLKHWNDSSPWVIAWEAPPLPPSPSLMCGGMDPPSLSPGQSGMQASVSPPSRCLVPLPPPVSRSGARFVCSAYRH